MMGNGSINILLIPIKLVPCPGQIKLLNHVVDGDNVRAAQGAIWALKRKMMHYIILDKMCKLCLHTLVSIILSTIL